jgi:hypothetical protein
VIRKSRLASNAGTVAYGPKNTIPTSATPSALPTCCSVEDIPETVPACAGETAPSTVPTRPDRATPIPSPPTASPGTSHGTETFSAAATRSRTWPAANVSAAAVIPPRAPSLPSTRAATRLPAMYGSATAVNTAPEAGGPRPRPSCRYSDSTRK